MPIKGLNPALPEMGKIKIGGHGSERQGKSGTYRLPEKYDHFVVTGLEKDDSDNFVEDVELTETLAIKKCKDHGKPTTLGPCIFMFDDPDVNFYTAYRYYSKSQLLCCGDGEKATKFDDGEKVDIPCDPATCPNIKKKLCKPNGILSVVFPQSKSLGGVYKFRTTSYNTIKELMSQLQMFRALTGGRLAGIPFYLVLTPREAVVEGKKVTIYIVCLEFKGGIDGLLESAKSSMPAITSPKHVLIDNEAIMAEPDEFYPEAVEVDGMIVDPEGNVTDVVDDAPEGKGAFSPNNVEAPNPDLVAPEPEPTKAQPVDSEEANRIVCFENIVKPAVSGYMHAIDNESPSGATLVDRIDPGVDKSEDLSLENMKKLVASMQLEATKASDRANGGLDTEGTGDWDVIEGKE